MELIECFMEFDIDVVGHSRATILTMSSMHSAMISIIFFTPIVAGRKLA